VLFLDKQYESSMRESALTLATRLDRCQWLMNAVLPIHCQLGRDALAQLTRAVTIVEGERDRRLLHRFYGTRLAQKRVLVVPLQCSNELGGMADAAVIPALGLPVVALLDKIRGSTREELKCLPTPNKAERGATRPRTRTRRRAAVRPLRRPRRDLRAARGNAPDDGSLRGRHVQRRFSRWRLRDALAPAGVRAVPL
jgi:hypothetical protein